MAAPRILILRAPGTNCDQETAHAFALAGGDPELIHINQLLAEPQLPEQFQILCIPGGFSYGDDVAAGRILANQMKLNLADTMQEFKAADKLILGVCNGFQVLIKSGVLLPDNTAGAPATLAWNDSGRFEDRWVRLRVDSDRCVFLRGSESLYLPVAHAEGKFVARAANDLDQFGQSGQLVLRYASTDPSTNGHVPYPENPNGSQANVAGVCDETGRVFGLMPHPERFVDPTQHPRWTRGEASEVGDGLAVFKNAVEFFA
ncbi:MAG: phosphoribosylformylglycinamidine synthase I [Pirellulaceae bacterium]|jgi:phosphoribosylformylglycinamidine synthase|nr:phosphoribosylformylglycinamidine synthase I [Pirellulaceae bacterium]MDP7014645.1 phosphoribosylformylglycinamidine synthase I [Pirellulaceae bacterium]